MALIFTDPNTAGPFTSFQVKDLQCKVFKLTNANFNTTPVNTLVGRLPCQSSIVAMVLWTKTQLAGGSISAATLSVGTTSAGTDFVNANAAAFQAAGVQIGLSPITNIYQPYNVPYNGQDINIWVSGAATGGNPTSGEMYLRVDYVN